MTKLLASYPFVTAFSLVLLFYGCGGENAIDNPIASGAIGEKPDSSRYKYFPLTTGSFWVYRNPDGSTWTRKVIATSHRVANPDSASYQPLISVFDRGPDLDFSYKAKQNSLFLTVDDNAVNAAVWHTILQSGGEDPDWSIDRTNNNGIWRTFKSTDNILAYLHNYATKPLSHSDITLIHFPLDPLQKEWTAISIRLLGHHSNAPHLHTHTFEAITRISAIVSYAGLIETPRGTFTDCVKNSIRGGAPP